MKINDGTGSGRSAKVDTNNRVSVHSIVVPDVSDTSEMTGRSFQVHTERTLTCAATFENIMTFRYTGNRLCKIKSIVFAKEDAALVPGTSQAMFELMVNSTRTSGGASVTPINMNLGSSVVSDVEIYTGTSVITICTSGQAELMDLAVQNTYTHDLQGAFILTKNTEFSIIGKSKTIGDTLHAVIFYYEVDQDS